MNIAHFINRIEETPNCMGTLTLHVLVCSCTRARINLKVHADLCILSIQTFFSSQMAKLCAPLDRGIYIRML